MKIFCISFRVEAFHPGKKKSICFKLDKEAGRGLGVTGLGIPAGRALGVTGLGIPAT